MTGGGSGLRFGSSVRALTFSMVAALALAACALEGTEGQSTSSSSATALPSAVSGDNRGPAPTRALVWGLDGLGPYRWGDPIDQVEPWLRRLFGPPSRDEERNRSDLCNTSRPGLSVWLTWQNAGVGFHDGVLDSFWISGESRAPSVWGFSTGDTIDAARLVRPDITVTRVREPSGPLWHISEPSAPTTGARLWGTINVDKGQDTIGSAFGEAPGSRVTCID